MITATCILPASAKRRIVQPCYWLRATLLLLAVASPALVRAQFQQPIAEELKMTDDPKAPGAAAVYLYREEVTDDSLHFHSYYERIKILTEKGKELATIHIPYEPGEFKVTSIVGRTIHADGTIIPLATGPADLMDTKNKGIHANAIVFTLPGVEVGSVLEYRLKLSNDENTISSPAWNIQQPFFIHKAHYFFSPPVADGNRTWTPSSQMAVRSRSVFADAGKTRQWNTVNNKRGEGASQLMYVATSVPPEKVVSNDKGAYSLDLTDIPALPNDDWMPPIDTLRWRIQFYYTYAHSGAEFWDSEQKQWAKRTEQLTNPTDSLKTAIAQIISPSDTDEAKARKIYAAVMKLNNTNFTSEKQSAEPGVERQKVLRNAEEVWKQQSGSADEMTLLYVALARAAGLKILPMQVVNRERANFDVRLMSIDQLNDYLAIVEIGGKEVFLDPGQKMCPFGSLYWGHTLASGFRLSDKGAILDTAPPNTYRDAVVQRFGDLEINADGKVDGTIRFVMTGPVALRWRQAALENDQEQMKRVFDHELESIVPEGIEARFDHFVSLDNPDTALLAVVKVHGSLGATPAKRFQLPGFFFQTRSEHPFVDKEKRPEIVDMHFSDRVTDEVIYHLPAGFSVESAPQDSKISWPEHALLLTKTTSAPDKVTIVRSLACAFTFAKPEEYQDLRSFYQKVAAADQQQLVLTTATPATKGN